MSTTTYSHPCGARSARQVAFARTSASVTLAPKESQLFQPIGGVAATCLSLRAMTRSLLGEAGSADLLELRCIELEVRSCGGVTDRGRPTAPRDWYRVRREGQLPGQQSLHDGDS